MKWNKKISSIVVSLLLGFPFLFVAKYLLKREIDKDTYELSFVSFSFGLASVFYKDSPIYLKTPLFIGFVICIALQIIMFIKEIRK